MIRVSNLTRLPLRQDDLPEVEGKIEGLMVKVGELGCQIRKLDRDVGRLESQQIDTREFRRVFRELPRKLEDPKPPTTGGSGLQGDLLREQDSNLQPCGYG